MNLLSSYKLNVFSLVLLKITQLIATILITKELLDIFSVEDYGLIVILSSFAQLVMIDTGSGEAVKKKILQSTINIGNIICSGIVVTALLSIIISIFSYFLFRDVLSDVEVDNVILILLMSSVIMTFKISREVFSAIHMTFIHSFILSLSILFSIYYVYNFQIETVMEAVVVQHGALLVGNILVFLFMIKRLNLNNFLFKVDIKGIRSIFPDSFTFFLIGVSLMLINGIDIILLTSLGLNKKMIAEISLLLKVSVYIHTFFMFLIYPSWPMLSSIKDNKKNITNYIMFFVILFSAILIIIVGTNLFTLIKMWTNLELKISNYVIWSFLLFTYLRLVSDLFDYVLRANGVLKYQMYFTPLEAILHLSLCVFGWHVAGLIGYSVMLPISTFFGRLLPFLFQLKSNKII